MPWFIQIEPVYGVYGGSLQIWVCHIDKDKAMKPNLMVAQNGITFELYGVLSSDLSPGTFPFPISHAPAAPCQAALPNYASHLIHTQPKAFSCPFALRLWCDFTGMRPSGPATSTAANNTRSLITFRQKQPVFSYFSRVKYQSNICASVFISAVCSPWAHNR